MIALPEVSPAAVPAANAVAARLPIGFRLGATALIARLGNAAVPGDWPAAGARLGEGRFVLRFDPALLPEAASHWSGAGGLPDDLRAILHGVLLREVGEALAAALGETPGWGAAEGAERSHRLLLTGADGALIAAVEADDAGLGWLARRMAALPVLAGEAEGVPVILRLLLDRPRMRMAEVAALGRGDVLLLDRDPDDLLVLLPGGRGWRAALAGGRLTLTAVLDAPMDEPEGLPPASLDEMPLLLECEIGRLTMPLAEVRTLAVGQVLDLGADATGVVTLRVNGQAVATGELVRIAGRTGIRLTDVRTGRPS